MSDDNAESTREAALEGVDVFLRRSGVVESLVDGPKDKPELVEDLSVSRSTVDRATRELESAGLAEYVGGRFVLTPLGEFAQANLSDLLGTVRLRQQMDSFLQWVPQSEFGVDLSWLTDADIYLPEPGDPYNMVNRHVHALREAESAQVVLPLTGLHAFEAAHDAVVDDGAVHEFVVVPEVAETYESNPNYAPLYEEMVETGRFDLYVYDGDIPYYLGILDGTVQIGADEEGDPRAMLEADSNEMQEWAENEYERYRQQAESVM